MTREEFNEKKKLLLASTGSVHEGHCEPDRNSSRAFDYAQATWKATADDFAEVVSRAAEVFMQTGGYLTGSWCGNVFTLGVLISISTED